MSKHTPPPWTVKGPAGPDRDTAIIADGMIVAETWGHVAEGVRADSFAAASRIVACVNALDGMDICEVIMLLDAAKRYRLSASDLEREWNLRYLTDCAMGVT